MKLHRIDFTHYGPKDSETGIHSYVITDDEALIPENVGSLADRMQDWEDDGDEGSVEPRPSWWEANPDAVDRAKALGLTVHLGDWGKRHGLPESVSGPMLPLLLWWRCDPSELSDLYYGATQYHWDAGRPITEDEAATLVRLGIAEVLR